MATPLSEHPLALQWLRHFGARDVHTARLMLHSLKLVSFSEFEEVITRQIQGIATRTEGRIALFAVDKDADGQSRLASSAERIGHCLTNLERLLDDRIRANPSVECMRAEKVKHVVLVDDILASGGRLRRFWNDWATKSLKSWLSYRCCRLWLVCYAAHEQGIRAARRRITYLAGDQIIAHVALRDDASYWNERIEVLCEQHGQKTAKPRAAKGVGQIMCPIVFQHGCPNNCPSILWSNGKTWRALFPNRAIDPQLYQCFRDADDCGRNPELLWNSGQYRLALQLINDLASGKKSRTYIDLLTILGLLLKGVKASNLNRVVLMPNEAVQGLLSQARALGFMDDAFNVTDFGRDIVERTRGVFMTEKKELEIDSEAEQFYVPTQFRGVRRKSSTGI
jgi:hypothetical protein